MSKPTGPSPCASAVGGPAPATRRSAIAARGASATAACGPSMTRSTARARSRRAGGRSWRPCMISCANGASHDACSVRSVEEGEENPSTPPTAGKRRTGKCRSIEVFLPGRRNSALSHFRVGSAPAEVQVAEVPRGIPAAQRQALAQSCQALHFGFSLGAHAVPEVRSARGRERAEWTINDPRSILAARQIL
ncbi:hypothetical protein BDK51DRAFT_47413 [Blyttiomyces helicus]|uniref:Uncharacterized protein n=1 Tax=Blyttiomyces helicus TaxID=388810 RepID=A0A4P9W0F0_9FUNG|nr:hypothetical protein BDK51DRAFT_47413 [Blyttiomyces helicus]|eukprot:RKO84795.1 hypothetical protein BDK51DRAFT_47413 [Blyttiomyces helicus]